MAYLDETGLKQVFTEVKSRIDSAKSEASSAGTTAASNVQANLDKHTQDTSNPHSVTKEQLGYDSTKIAATLSTDQTSDSQIGLGISVTDGFGNTASKGTGTYRFSSATETTAGVMSAADKKKLNGIAAGANNYTLPTANSTTLGGVKTGSNITNNSGTISLTSGNVTGALGFTPVDSASANYVKSLSISGKTITVTKGNNSTATLTTQDTTYGNATTSAAGLMSAADKVKVDKLLFDTSGKISSSILPSYVDDVIEGYVGYYNTGTASTSFYVFMSKEPANSSSVTTTELNNAIAGESGKIYVDIKTNKTYRWVASEDTTSNSYGNMVEISSGIAIGNTSSTAYAGDKGAALEKRMTAVETKASANASSISSIGSAISTTKVTSTAKTVFGD